MRCAICWQRQFEEFSAEVPGERFLRFVDECADFGAREWCIAGGGEPIMRASLVMDMCERIRARNMNGALMTNGLAFKEEHYLRLARAGWANLVFSLDGHTPEVNDAIRSNGSFERATGTMRKIKTLREQGGFKAPLCTLHATVTSMNYRTLDKLVELAHELGCDAIAAGSLTDAGPHCDPFRLTHEQQEEAPMFIRRASERARDLGLIDGLDAVLDERAYLHPPAQDAVGLSRAMCFEPWLTLVVHADGRAGPCCIYWDKHSPSLMEASLRDIWLGPNLTQAREGILSGRLPACCRACSPAPPSVGKRDSLLRHQLIEAQREPSVRGMGALQKVRFFFGKTVRSVQRHGIRQALARGKEYVRMHLQR